MAYDIIHKNSTVAGTPPAASEIEVGEIAINAADAELYVKDNAGNIRKFQNTTTGTSDGVQFTQTGTGAVQRTVESKLQDVVSVLDFIPQSEHAAIRAGTSTYDCTADIQAALNAGGKIYLPKGTYLVTNTLQLTTTDIAGKRPELLGDGGNTSTTVIDFQPATPGIPLINHFHTGRYEGIYFKGPGASTGAGEVAFDFGNVGTQRHTIIQDCMFRYWDKAALYFSGQWNITVDNCRFLDCGNSASPVGLTGGVVFDQTVVTGWSTSGMIFSNCYFSGCSYGYYAEAAWNLTFINPIFEYCAYPYWRNAAGSAHVLIDPWFESNANDPVSTGAMVVLGGRGVGWTNNNVSTSSESGSIHITSNGIQVYKTSTPRINIKGNGYIAFENGYGIDFSATAGAGAADSIFSDYEYGTWTPVITDGTNNSSTTAIIATYTKIGNTVNIRAAILNINTAGLTAGNQIKITGLPYATGSAASTWQHCPITVDSMSSTEGSIVGQLRNSSTELLLNNQTTTGLSSALVSQITSGSGDIYLNFSYFA
jgi:hypothetical protein